jgi:hypothetical protein
MFVDVPSSLASRLRLRRETRVVYRPGIFGDEIQSEIRVLTPCNTCDRSWCKPRRTPPTARLGRLVKDIGKRCMSDAGGSSYRIPRVAVDKVLKAASIDQGQVSEMVIVAGGISDGYGRQSSESNQYRCSMP